MNPGRTDATHAPPNVVGGRITQSRPRSLDYPQPLSLSAWGCLPARRLAQLSVARHLQLVARRDAARRVGLDDGPATRQIVGLAKGQFGLAPRGGGGGRGRGSGGRGRGGGGARVPTSNGKGARGGGRERGRASRGRAGGRGGARGGRSARGRRDGVARLSQTVKVG